MLCLSLHGTDKALMAHYRTSHAVKALESIGYPEHLLYADIEGADEPDIRSNDGGRSSASNVSSPARPEAAQAGTRSYNLTQIQRIDGYASWMEEMFSTETRTLVFNFELGR